MLASNKNVVVHCSQALMIHSQMAWGPTPASNLLVYSLKAKSFYIFKVLLKNKNYKKEYVRDCVTPKAENIYHLPLYGKKVC